MEEEAHTEWWGWRTVIGRLSSSLDTSQLLGWVGGESPRPPKELGSRDPSGWGTAAAAAQWDRMVLSIQAVYLQICVYTAGCWEDPQG